MEAREIGVKEDGTGGVAVDDIVAMKIVTIELVVGIMALVGGCSLGDVANKVITFFDEYANDTKTEGTAKTTGTADPNGTSAHYDLLYHYAILIASYVTFTVIALGGFWFASEYISFNDDIKCDFNAISESAKADAAAIISQITGIE